MKVYQRMLSSFGVLVALFYLSGCASTGMDRASMDAANLYGDPLIIDIPLQDPSDLPSDGDRSLFPAVYFTYDSSVLNPEQSALCEAVAQHLKRGGGVILEGHADERGSREYNLALGERRALAVRAYLLALGIDAVTSRHVVLVKSSQRIRIIMRPRIRKIDVLSVRFTNGSTGSL